MGAHVKVSRIVVTLLTLVLPACNDQRESQTRGLELVVQSKTATGGKAWDEIAIWHEQGEVVSPSGPPVPYEHWGDLRNLRARNTQAGGTSYMIFDGVAAYACPNPECTPPRPIDVPAMMAGQYRVSFGFFFPDRFPAIFEYEGSKDEKGVTFEVVRVSPSGLDPVDVWINRDTHRVERVVYADGRNVTHLSDYRKVGSVEIPFAATENGVTVRARAVAFEPAAAVAFSLPGANPEGLFVFVRIPDAVLPIERGSKYEDPIAASLKAAQLGEVTGGGTQLGRPKADGTKGIEWVGVDVQLSDGDAGLKLLREKLKDLGAPKGTILEYMRDGKTVEEMLW